MKCRFKSFQDVIDRAQALLKIRHKPETITNYTLWIRRFLDFASESGLDVSEISFLDMQDYLIELDENDPPYADRTYNVAVYALRFLAGTVFGWPDSEKQLPRKKAKRTPKETFTSEQVHALIAGCEDPQLKAVIVLGCSCGLRIDEIVKLKFRDFNKSQKIITIWFSKHDGSRNVPFQDSAAEILRQYCHSRNIYRVSGESYLFPDEKKPGACIKTSATTRRFMQYLQTFDFYLPGHSFHSLRHFYATQMDIRGIPLNQIARLLGHSCVATTAGYIHSDENDKKEIPDLLLQEPKDNEK